MTSGACCLVATLAIAAAAAADSTDFFLREIFHKYGNSGVITYEGFEHLLESLGIGRLEFDQSHSVALHRVNGTFQEVHDQLRLHTHDHPHHDRRRRGVPDTDSPLELDLGIPPPGDDAETSDVSPQQETQPAAAVPGPCLSAQELLRSHGLPAHHDVLISQPVFLHLCPAIVYEIDQRACYAHEAETASASASHSHSHGHGHALPAGATASSWLYATLSIAIISVSGILGLIVVPLASKAYYHQVLSFLIATAVGTLCGDALLHMLPHALSVGDDHVAHAFHSLVVFGAMVFFYCMETVLRIQRANGYKKKLAIKDMDVEQKIINSGETGSNMDVGIIMQDPERKSSFSRKHTHTHSHGLSTHDHDVSSVAWIVIVGDGLHNLTDGLAIGAAFAGSTAAGLATAIAVFFHELPHELGDFAVLLQSGMSIRRAVVYNILSSVLSFLGMACGLWVGEYEDAAMWIYSATAGSFLYIALVDLLPEMNSSGEDPPTIRDLIIHILGIAAGGAIMLTIALYEEKLGTLFN